MSKFFMYGSELQELEQLKWTLGIRAEHGYLIG